MDKIAIAVKRSKWERDLIRYGSPDEVKKIYRIQNNAFSKIFESHQRQKESLRALQKRLNGARYLHREELPHCDFSEFDCLISLGGDNHFVYVSQFADSRLKVIGINSDPLTSSGALLYFDTESLVSKLPNDMQNIQLTTESWTRIDCELIYPSGKSIKTFPAISEISIHSAFSDYISRYLIRINLEKWEEQKSSGLLLSTGVGSTGWFMNCHWSHLQEQSIFRKDANFFRLIARELPATKTYRFHLATVEAEEKLELVSEMDGEVVIDAHPDSTYDFPPGCRALFSLSKEKLEVITDISSR